MLCKLPIDEYVCRTGSEIKKGNKLHYNPIEVKIISREVVFCRQTGVNYKYAYGRQNRAC